MVKPEQELKRIKTVHNCSSLYFFSIKMPYKTRKKDAKKKLLFALKYIFIRQISMVAFTSILIFTAFYMYILLSLFLGTNYYYYYFYYICI